MAHQSGPAQEVLDAAERVSAAALRISDPIQRADALEAAGANVAALQKRIRAMRAGAIRHAINAEKRSATSVAEELGISRARLYQILDGAEDLEYLTEGVEL